MLITGPKIKPPPHPFYGDSYERGLDPWHRDAFPDEFKDAAPNQKSKRGSGWFLQDAWGNDIGFVPDGTKYPASPPTTVAVLIAHSHAPRS